MTHFKVIWPHRVLLTVYIIVKLLLKVVQEITLLSNYAPRGRDSGSLLWKNIDLGEVQFANVLEQMPGGSPRSTHRDGR